MVAGAVGALLPSQSAYTCHSLPSGTERLELSLGLCSLVPGTQPSQRAHWPRISHCDPHYYFHLLSAYYGP